MHLLIRRSLDDVINLDNNLSAFMGHIQSSQEWTYDTFV